MSAAYLGLAQQGQNQWWRFLLSIVVILTFWFGIGAIPILAVLAIGVIQGKVDLLASDPMQGADPLGMYAATLLSFIPLLAGVFIAVRIIHGRRFATLVTPFRRMNWKRLGLGFGLWFLLAGLMTGTEAVLYPERYEFSFNLAHFVPYLLVSLVLIPIQTSTEELFFRGYILQSLGLLVRNPVLLSILNGILFWLPHLGNPEIETDFWLLSATYIAIGVFLAAITLRSQGLELALGMHAANNLFASIVASYPHGALPTPAFFSVTKLDPVFGLVSTVAGALFFYVVVFKGFAGLFEQKQQRSQNPG